ncbi:MAG: sulfatase-like hydrolase/transferase [Planctomycetota bacterium]
MSRSVFAPIVDAAVAATVIGVFDLVFTSLLPGPQVAGVSEWLVVAASLIGQAALLGLGLGFSAWLLAWLRPFGRKLKLEWRGFGLDGLIALIAVVAYFEFASWALFDGANVSRQSWAIFAKWGFRALVLGGSFVAVRWCYSLLADGRRHQRAGALLLVLSTLALLVNTYVLRGLYAELHQLLVVFATLTAVVACTLSFRGRRLDPARRTARAVLVILGGLGLVLLSGWVRQAASFPRLQGTIAVRSPVNAEYETWLQPFYARYFPIEKIELVDVAEVFAALDADHSVDVDAALDGLIGAERRFNLLWIAIDTLRADRCGFLGYDRPTTPNLDRLAAESFVFERAYVAYPTSNFSYSSVLTSLPARLTPAYAKFRGLDWEFGDTSSLAGLLSARGWKTHGVTAFDKGTAEDPKWFGTLRDGFDVYNPDQKTAKSWAPDVNKSVKKIFERVGDKPWFVWLHYMEPHSPYVPHKGFSFGDTPQGYYDGEVAYCDAKAQEVIDMVAARGELDRTVIVMFSDHGEEFNEHGKLYHNSSTYEEQIRVPLLVRIPRLKGRRIKEAVNLMDLVPTLTRLMGVEDDQVRFGRSLLPSMTRVAQQPGFSYSEVFFFRNNEHSADQRAVILDDDKIIHRPYQDISEVYDLANDPQELVSLLGRDAAQDSRLLSILKAYDAKIDAHRGGSAAAPLAGNQAEAEAAWRRELDASIEGLRVLAPKEQSASIREIQRRLFSFCWEWTVESKRWLKTKGMRAYAQKLVDVAPEVTERTKSQIVRTLGYLGDPVFAPFLRETLTTSKGYMWCFAAISLARCGDVSVAPGLRSLLNDPSVVDQHEIAIALAHLGDPASLPWVFANIQSPARGIIIDTMRALPKVPRGVSVARVLRGIFTSSRHVTFEEASVLLDTIEDDRDPDATALILRMSRHKDPEIAERALAILSKFMTAEVLKTASDAASLEQEGDLAAKNKKFELAVIHYRGAMAGKPFYDGGLQFRMANWLRMAKKTAPAAELLRTIAADSPLDFDRQLAARLLEYIDHPLRINAKKFSVAVDAEKVGLPPRLRRFSTVRVKIPLANTSEQWWCGGTWGFATSFRVLFEKEDGTFLKARRVYDNYLPEAGLAPGEVFELPLVVIGPREKGRARLVVQMKQLWLKLPNKGIVYRHPTWFEVK